MPTPLLGQPCVLKGRILENEIDQGIPVAKVLVLREGTPLTGCLTDEYGFYCINRLDPGTYDLEISFGEEKSTVREVRLAPGEIKKMDIGHPNGSMYGMDPKFCPACNMTNRVIPIHYGGLDDRDSRLVRRRKLYHGEGKKGACSPSWYCKRDQIKY